MSEGHLDVNLLDNINNNNIEEKGKGYSEPPISKLTHLEVDNRVTKLNLLLNVGHADPNQLDSLGNPPLICWLQELDLWEDDGDETNAEFVNMVEIMLKKGAKADALGRLHSVLWYAVDSRVPFEVVELLLEYGANPFLKKGSSGESAMARAQRKNYHKAVDAFQRLNDSRRFLLWTMNKYKIPKDTRDSILSLCFNKT